MAQITHQISAIDSLSVLGLAMMLETLVALTALHYPLRRFHLIHIVLAHIATIFTLQTHIVVHPLGDILEYLLEAPAQVHRVQLITTRHLDKRKQLMAILGAQVLEVVMRIGLLTMRSALL